eukprot:gnl/Dysnectes_brevis/7222_a11915_238.p1 GENE.gnl/Dysnectes_brevis/7222_a11915_238~~gnl/Dysnectes_brevis/7222_a11915_238.p1  ORF type:complete len:186 (+),score=61.02 gnl/Dysnectes_brevis/7222_a11915_238:74-631(+)
MKQAIIFMANGFEEIEAISVIDILNRAKINVTIAGTHDQVISARKLKISCHGTLHKGAFEDTAFDACIFPGGMGQCTEMALCEQAHTLATKVKEHGGLIAAICAAPAVTLAAWPGFLPEGLHATCYPTLETRFPAHVTAETEPVVKHGQFITSRGPGTAAAFAFAVVEHLVGEEVAAKVRKSMLF